MAERETDERQTVEQLATEVNQFRDVIGRLLVYLVEARVMTEEQAGEILERLRP